ncbi:hypothetical protein I4U23_012355 [Adineta vaga]|nr:hypothetical protein I4U23_012355 [Adineta vaga]
MKHVEAWHYVAENQIKLALILEDDPLFVPFFRKKLERVIYTAIRTGALRIDTNCLNLSESRTMRNDEWIYQEPMIVIGTCFDFYDESFNSSVPDPQPLLTTHKLRPSRCAHAYMITACSARAMLREIAAKPTEIDTPDFLMNELFPRSHVLQSFWADPPLVYQGNRVDDLEQLQTFKETKYQLKAENKRNLKSFSSWFFSKSQL